MRPSGRAPDQMRTLTIETAFTKHAEGSVLTDKKLTVRLAALRRYPRALHRLA